MVNYSEDSLHMHDQAELLWYLFETSGCIIYYLLYKKLLSNWIKQWWSGLVACCLTYREAVPRIASAAKKRAGEFTWEQWTEIAVGLTGGRR